MHGLGMGRGSARPALLRQALPAKLCPRRGRERQAHFCLPARSLSVPIVGALLRTGTVIGVSDNLSDDVSVDERTDSISGGRAHEGAKLMKSYLATVQ